MTEDTSERQVGLRLRLRGGGGDGGVMPLTHAEMKWMTPSGMGEGGRGHNMAWTHQWKGKVEEDAIRVDRAKTCAASRQPLERPVAVCELGYLLNKEATIELLMRKAMPEHMAHIKGLKDIAEATLHDNPSFDPAESHKAGADDDEFPYFCPIAHVPLNGRIPFVFIRPSGHIVSERALKQIGGSMCPVTEVPIANDDIVPINGTNEQREALAEKAAARKAAKKAKAASKKAAAAAAAPSTELAAGMGAVETGSGLARDAAAAMPPPSGGGSGGGGSSSRKEKEGAVAVGGGGKAKAKECSEGAKAGTAGETGPVGKRGREWEAVIAQKAASSSAYKSLFYSAEDKKRYEAEVNANYCARGTTPRYSS